MADLQRTFLSILDEANVNVQKEFTGAQFYEADNNQSRPGTPWRFVFNVPAANSQEMNSTAFINYFPDLGIFGPIQHIDQPWLDNRVVPLPIALDLSEAKELVRKAGYTGDITVINLRWALYPGVNEPSYIFTMTTNVHVFVGVYTKTVQPYQKAAILASDDAHLTQVAVPSKLALVDSTEILGSTILINPSVLVVKAQPSGFNWKVSIKIGEHDPQVEYLPYFIVETQDGPEWPSQGGIGPVIPPVTLSQVIYKVGTKGIAVVGSNHTIHFDYQPYLTPSHREPK